MKAIPIIGIPVLNRGDLLLRNVMSIDYPVKKLYLINNGNDESVAAAIIEIQSGKNKLIEELCVYKSPENLGVAPSWNRIIKENPDAPYWFIIGNDIFFETAGELQKMYEYAERAQHTHSFLGLGGGQGYSCFVLTKLGLDKVGYFDENIFPAYLEDCDHHYRLLLAGATIDYVPLAIKHGEAPSWGSMTIHSDKQYRAANGVTHAMNFEYYRRKWGGDNGKEEFQHPFNNPMLPIDYWELEVERRETQKKIWGAK